VMWTAALARGFTVADVASWLCAGPASLIGRPAAIRVGTRPTWWCGTRRRRLWLIRPVWRSGTRRPRTPG
jgi:hypothetical protein